jgi:hypothetical protein
VTLSLDEMIEAMHTHARAVLIGDEKAQVLPFFHVQFKDRPDSIVPTPWRDDREKSAIVRSIREAMRLVRPSIVNYAFLSEAWLAQYDHAPRPGMVMPRERETKREVVVVSAGDHERAKMKVWEIVRDDKGRPSDLVEDKEGYDNFEGRLTNLLNDD